MHRIILGTILFLVILLNGCARTSALRSTAPADDLRIGASLEQPFDADGSAWLALYLEGGQPISVDARERISDTKMSGESLRAALYDADGKKVTTYRRNWRTSDNPMPAPMFFPDHDGRYELRIAEVAPNIRIVRNDRTMILRLIIPSEDVVTKTMQTMKTEEADRKRRLEQYRREIAVKKKIEAEQRARDNATLSIQEQDMRQCACVGTGYHVLGYVEEYGVGARIVPRTVYIVAGSTQKISGRGVLAVDRFHFKPYACPNCKGANTVREPPSWKPSW